MTPTYLNADSQIVKRFLMDASSRRHQNEFCDVCWRHILTSLRMLESRGWKVRTEAAGDRRLAQAAATLLTDFLAPPSQRPFKAVFDYFDRIGMADSGGVPGEELLYCLIGQIRSYVRQKAGRLDEEPWVAKLRNRVNEILRDDAFHVFRCGGVDCVASVEVVNDLGTERPPLQHIELYQLVYDCACRSSSRADWCRRTVAALAEVTERRRFAPKWELRRAMIAVNRDYVDIFAPGPATIGEIIPGYPATADKCARGAALWIEGNGLRVFVKKGRFTEDQAGRVLSAVELFLADTIHSGVASLREYFRETMPEELDARYLEDYKYPFETTIRAAQNRFIDCMKRNLH